MRILVVDFLFVKAHQSFNENVLKALVDVGEVDVLNVNGYYDKSITAAKYIDMGLFLFKSGAIKTRINSLLVIFATFFYLLKNRKKYDAVFCLAFDTLTLVCGGFSLIFKGPFYLFHHKNIDELTNSLKRIVFKIYQKKYIHIVFEKEFAQQLKTISGLENVGIKVVPHPICSLNIKKDASFDCVGLCNSNKAEFIEDLYKELERKDNSSCLFVVRGLKKIQLTNNLLTINSFLSIEQYWDYIYSAKSVFVALPTSYKARLSGSIYDAFSAKKKVFTTSQYHASLYEQLYPGICEYVSSAKDLINKVKLINYDGMAQSFDKFIINHSVKSLSIEIEKIMSEV